MDIDWNDAIDFFAFAVAAEDFHVLGIHSGNDRRLLSVNAHVELLLLLLHAALRAGIVADARERIGRRVLRGAEFLDNPLHGRKWRDAAVGQLLTGLCERADRDNAFVAIVELVRFVTMRAKLGR